MSIVHRFLLRELFVNVGIALSVVLGAFFLIAIALSMGQTRFESIPLWIVIQWTTYQVVANLHLSIPLAVIVGSIFTYGRLVADGEYGALETSGTHPWRVLAPALLVGALGTVALAGLQDRVMPRARLVARKELAEDVLRDLESVLQRGNVLSGRYWKAHWTGRRVADDGSLVLEDLELLEFERDGRVRAHTSAKRAQPSLDPEDDTIRLDLTDLQRAETSGRFGSASRWQMELPFAAIASAKLPRRDNDHRDYEELALRWTRKDEAALLAEDASERDNLEESAREARAAFHQRVAFAASPLLFAFLGAGLGLVMGMRNRAFTFVLGFLIVVAGYYPLMMFGSWLGDEGILPPFLALQTGNFAVLVGGSWLYRRLVRA
jgi:lipopolysaccharide export LptBFGC system permease protein LptF